MANAVLPPAYTRAERVRIVVIAGVVPLVFALAGAGAILSWLPDLPDPVAYQWGAGGVSNYGSAWGIVGMLVGIVAIFSGVILFGLLPARSASSPSSRPQLTVAVGVFLSCTLSIGMPGSLWTQRGLADAADAPSPHWFLLAGALVGVAAGAVAFRLTPRQRVIPVDGRQDAAPALRLGEGERVIWSGTASASRWLVIGITAAVVVLAVFGLAAPTSGEPAAQLVFLVTPALVFLVLGATLFWRVRVDGRGVVVRSVAGLPRFTVPLSDIVRASVVSINPLTDFGGWGLRWGGKGRFGVVLRGGEALEITRSSGRSFVVTMAHAAEVAAVVNGLVDRERAERSRPVDGRS